MQRIADLRLKGGLPEKRIDVQTLLERPFVPSEIEAAKVEVE
ncbi:MAG: hypothetical protein OZ929_23640 [Bryobacterales bacterium]|nr:hypothetical protein [Bryobacterales bacterium]